MTLGLFGCLWSHTPAGGQTDSVLPGSEAPNARVLTAEQIRRVFVGNTASGEDEDGTPFDAHLSGDATLKLKYGDTSYTGTWHINHDGKLCGSLEEFFVTDTMCFTVDGRGGSAGEGLYFLIGDNETIKVRVVGGGVDKF